LELLLELLRLLLFFFLFLGIALFGLLPFAGIAIIPFSPKILATLVVG